MPGTVAGERVPDRRQRGGLHHRRVDRQKSDAVGRDIGETVSLRSLQKLPDAAYTNLVVLDALPPYIDYADVSDITLGCSTTDSNYANPGDCSSGVSATFLGPFRGSPGATGQQIGWSFERAT